MTAHLICIVGGSGSGKGSLMRRAQERLADDSAVLFAHRYVSRPAEAAGENHVALSPREFAAGDAAHRFALRRGSQRPSAWAAYRRRLRTLSLAAPTAIRRS